MRFIKLKYSPLSCLPVAVALMITHSQSAQAVLEEVIVTAQKREQSVQDVGIAITAISGDDLRTFGFTESVQVVAMTPGVSRSGSSGEQTAQFSIRGVTQNDFSDHVETPNAVYVDEGYIGFSQAQVFGLFDLDRVEVLKGPQGTLFGRNATGGLVHFITKKPTREFEAFANVTYGSYDQVRFEGAAGGPLSEKLAVRISTFYNDFDPILDNKFPLGLPAGLQGSKSGAADYWSDHQWAFRGQLDWDVSDDVELLVSAFASKKTPSSGNFQNLATTAIVNDAGGQVGAVLAAKDPQGCMMISASTGACVGGTRPIQGADYFGYQDPDGSGEKTSTDHATNSFNQYETEGVTAKLSWNFESTTFTAVSHYLHAEKRQSLDTDSGPTPATVVMNNSDSDTFTQELRLNGEHDNITWVAGAYYLHIDAVYHQGLSDTEGGINIFGAPVPIEDDFTADLVTDSYSLFGQIDYGLTDTLTLVLGARVILEEKDYAYESYFFENLDDRTVDNKGTPLSPFLPAFSDETSDTLWTAKAQLEYRPNEDYLFYGGINRGVKAGSFNAPLLDFLTDEQYGYDEEVLMAYEVGAKLAFADGRIRVNGSVYYYDYKDYQAFSFGGISGAIFNQDADYQGVELEVQAFPTSDLSILLGASYIDAEISNLAIAPNVFRDVEPAFTPEVKLNALIRYEIPAEILGGRLALQLDGTYTSSFYQTIKNFDAHETDSYTIGNARISWLSNDGVWDIAVFAKNFGDVDNKVTAVDLSGLCGCTEQSWGAPVWYGIQIGVNF